MKESLIKALKEPLNEYKSIPFWSWNNTLDEKELVRQIDDMYSVGIGGFIMHARTGLKDEYLGEKWFSCIAACLKRARELGMQAWIYDENGWPSGFVGGKLLETERFRARFLEYSVGGFDDTAFAVYIADEKSGYVRIKEPLSGVNEYHNVYLRVSPANTDILNPEAVDAFIEETHEKYYARFKESFGREIAGFFTDEPQYYRWATPYTPYAEVEFLKEGRDVKDGLIWLFVHDERGYEFRTKYYGVLNKLYVENFYKKLYDWCESHGCKLTGHSLAEETLFGQMWAGACVSTTYEYEHIPAMDWLGRDCCGQLAPKQVSSVASQLGKKFVLTETFACCGYDVTPKELKSVAEAQYFNGVTTMCQHLYPYSIAAQGKYDHPPVFSRQGNWFEGFKDFNDYFTRLGYIIANTEDNCDIAVINPVRDVWLDYVRSEDYESVKETEDRFDLFLKTLQRKGITFQLIDERILEKYGGAEGNLLRVGKKTYGTVVVPVMRNISSSTLAALQEFKGRLCVLGKPEYVDGVKTQIDLHGNTTMAQIEEGVAVKFHCRSDNCFLTSRSGEIGDFLFIKNLSGKNKETVIIDNVGNEYVELDLNTLTMRRITDEIVLEESGGLVLVKDKNAKPEKKRESVIDVTSQFAVSGITENYLVLDQAEMSKNNAEYGGMRPIQALFDELLREDFKGGVTIRHTFYCKNVMPIKLVMEKTDYEQVKINGNNIELKQSAFDVNFVECDVTDFLKEGKNIIEYSLQYAQHEGVHFALFDPLATESVRNCLYFDVSLEPVYLKGDFVVENDGAIKKRDCLPPVTSALHKSGYPFFKGELTLTGTINKPKTGRAILTLDGRFLTAEIKANGEQIRFVTDTKGDITDILKAGENKLEIVLRSSLRNLFGPHHYQCEGDPFFVAPNLFTMRGEWKNGEDAQNYTPEYKTVPFGVDKILLKSL